LPDYYRQEFHPSFRKDLKNLDKPLRQKIFDLLDYIAQSPNIGERLTGDLGDIFSYHFSYSGTQYRIAYTLKESEIIIYFISVGVRENFYTKLKSRIS